MRAICLLAALAVSACSQPDDRRDRDPFVPDNNSTPNNVAQNNTSNSTTNNASTGSNNAMTNGSIYGEYEVAMDEDCEGIAGLNGATLIAGMVGALDVEMADLDAETSAHTNARDLAIGLTWPGDAVALCYPQFEEAATFVQPRLGIKGLTMTVATADGEFSESMPAGAWLSTNDGVVGSPSVIGDISAADMQGTYTPGAEVVVSDPRLSVFSTLGGPNGVRGNIAFTRGDSVGSSYGSFTGRQIVIAWPYTP